MLHCAFSLNISQFHLKIVMVYGATLLVDESEVKFNEHGPSGWGHWLLREPESLQTTPLSVEPVTWEKETTSTRFFSKSIPTLTHRILHLKVCTFDWLGRSAAFHPGALGGKRTLLFTIGTICFWHIAFFGVFFNLVLFFKYVLQEGSGVAARDANNWMGSMFLASLLGAFIAESSVGRLWACALCQTIALVGMVLMMVATKMILSAETTTAFVRAFFYISIYLLSMGYGSFVPALRSLGADQFDADADRAVFFSRYVIFDNVGMAVADTLVVYLASVKGWLFGFGVATVVLVAASRKWRIVLPTDSDDLYKEGNHGKGGKPQMNHTDSLRWLDKGATVMPSDYADGSTRNKWKLSSVTEVEEMKAVARLIPITATLVFFNTLNSQTATLLVEEGALMNASIAGGHLTMKPATMNLFNIAVVVLVVPLYNSVVVPLARRMTGLARGFAPLHETGMGYIASIVAVLIAAAVEAYRLHCVKQGLSPPSIFWQVPEFALLGLAQFLCGIGFLEFFYSYAPLSQRSLGSAFGLTGVALGSYVSSFLVWAVTEVSSRGGQGWVVTSGAE
ncbi:hypothetical protein GOP47_0006942 [Adiantum capillus-veneris]|uniref:Uncharacterized protein n=1 Tax=Adiantum capillus-veneris TaxID=13818 RepID=A0A9D4V0M9_ADICA|nr:hypothetical protein GOP47_0006942 [Adiantum capillus-veneris]